MSRWEVPDLNTDDRDGNDYMSHEDGMPPLDGFIAYLKQAWQMAGSPSYGEIARISEQLYKSTKASGMRVEILPRSTIQEILTGHRRQPPRWPWVASLWAVLRDIAGRSGIDPTCIGTLVEWKAKRDAVVAAHEVRRGTGAAGGNRNPSSRSETAHASGRNHAPVRLQVKVSAEQDFQGDPVLAMIRQRIGTEWWAEYHDVIPGWLGPYLSLEPAASQLRTYNSKILPGFLQTEQYASKAVQHDPNKLPQTLNSRLVDLQMRRQQLLVRSGAPRLWSIIDEIALRRQFGDPGIMRTQLEHLISLAEHPCITIQILPLNSSIYSAPREPIALLRFHQQDLPDVVQIELIDSALYVHHPDETGLIRMALSRLGSEALKPSDSKIFLHQILRET